MVRLPLRSDIEKKSNIRRHLEDAIRDRQIVPYFQPIVNLRTGNLSGLEILARWQHPVEGLLPPSRFIPEIEGNGSICELTNHLLATAASHATSWPGNPTLSLNISPVELHDRSLPQRLKSAAEAGGVSPSRLIVEITEGALIGDIALARHVIDELKMLGIRVALDDLGTGYSSLHHLQALPFDEVKIDACFVKQLTRRRESRKIAAAMIGLGLSLGLTTVAEGVEESEQAEMLACFGCTLAQGWLFGHPVSAEEVPGQIAKFPSPVRICGDSAGEIIFKWGAKPWDSLAELRAIYDGAPVGLCFLDRDSRILKFNRHLANMYRTVLLSTHVGRKLSDVSPGLARALNPHIESAISGKAVSDLKVRVKESRATKMLLLSCHPVRDVSGDVIGVSVAVLNEPYERRIKL